MSTAPKTVVGHGRVEDRAPAARHVSEVAELHVAGPLACASAIVVETKVAHRFGSKASEALEGRMVPSHEGASNKGRRPFGVSACPSSDIIHGVHLHTQAGFRDCGLVLLRQVELELLLKRVLA